MSMNSRNFRSRFLISMSSLGIGIAVGWLVVSTISIDPPASRDTTDEIRGTESRALNVHTANELDAVANASLVELRRLWTDSQPYELTEFGGILFARWVELDADDALALLSEIDEGPSRASFIEGLFYAWGFQDVEHAYQAAISLNGADREKALSQIQRLKSEPPFSLLARLVLEDEDFSDSASAFLSAWNNLTSGHHEFRPSDISPRALNLLIEQAAIHRFKENPAGSIEWLRSLSPELKLSAARASAMFLSQIGERDVFENVLSDHPALTQDREVMMAGAMTIADRDGGHKAGDWLQTNAGGITKIYVLGGLLINIGATDPIKATELFDYYVQNTSTGLTANVQRQLASWMAASDPAHALDWLDEGQWGITSGTGAQAAEMWAEQSLDDAKAYTGNLSSEFLRHDYAEGLGRYYGKTDPEAGIEWALNLGDDLSEDVMRGLVKEWSKSSPQEAGTFIRSIREEDLRKELQSELIQYWAITDAASAAEWVDTVGIGNIDPSTVSELINGWSMTDPYAASGWVNELPPGERRDRSAEALSFEVFDYDPEIAMKWALSITDGKLRAGTVGQMIARMFDDDEIVIPGLMTKIESSFTDKEIEIIHSYIENR